MLSTPPRIPPGDGVLVLRHAMDRPPDLVFLRFTCVADQGGWKPGETFVFYPLSTTSEFVIELKPGEITAHTYTYTKPNQTVNSEDLLIGESWREELVAVWFPPLLPSL